MRKTFKTSRYAMLLLLLLSLLMVACGGDDEEDEEDSDNNDNNTALVQPFVGVSPTGQTLTVNLPADWVGEVEESGVIEFASNQATLDQLNDTETSAEAVELNGVGGSLQIIDPELLPFMLPEGAEPNAQSLFEGMTAGGEGVGEASDFNVAGFSSGVKASITFGDNTGAFYVLFGDAGAVQVLVLSSQGFDTADAIVRSTVLTAGVALPEVTIPAVEDIVPAGTVPAVVETVAPAE